MFESHGAKVQRHALQSCTLVQPSAKPGELSGGCRVEAAAVSSQPRSKSEVGVHSDTVSRCQRNGL
jgi:hypothetical protein